MALEGSLHDFDIANIFQIISQENKTGRLIVTHEEKEGNIIFKHGTIVYAQTHNQKPLNMICKYLDHVKRYSKTEISELRAIFHDNLRNLSRELLEKNYLTENELSEIIETSITDISCSVFSWKEGHYKFETLPNTDRFQVGNFTCSVNAVGMESARQVDELKRMQEYFNGSTVFITTKKKKAKLDFSSVNIETFYQYLLQLIDGTSTVDFLCHESFFSEYQVYESLRELIAEELITPLAVNISSSVSEAIQRQAETGDISVSKSIFATLVSGIIIAGILFTGFFLYRGIIVKPIIQKRQNAISELDFQRSYLKVETAKIQYRIDKGKQASSFKELVEAGYLDKRDFLTRADSEIED